MAKGQKSSASSATRKKHARKAGTPGGDQAQLLPLPKEKKPKDKGKGKKDKEPRVKMYIPPAKPIPVHRDPIDTLGLAGQLPPDVLVVLRRLGKKDAVTKRKAMDDLREGWAEAALKDAVDDEDGAKEAALLTALPVWLHHVPALLLHSSRRIRATAASLHASLLRIPAVRERMLFFLREVGDSIDVENILGSWAMASYDIDRQVASIAKRSWDVAFPSWSALDETSFSLLINLTKRALFSPVALYTDMNPVQPAFFPPPLPHVAPRGNSSPRVKGAGGAKRTPIAPQTPRSPALDNDQPRKPEEEEESEEDRQGRLRVSALGVIRWVLEQDDTKASEHFRELLSSPILWTGLYHGSSPTFIGPSTSPPELVSESRALGANQPPVRKATWNVLLTLLKSHKDEVEALLPVLSSAVLRSAWVEPDKLVRAGMWEALLTFLTCFPRAWEIEWSNELSIHQTALAVNSSAHVGDAEDESDNMSVEDEDDEDDEDDDDDERTNNDGVERQEGAQSAIVASDASQHSRFTAFSEFLEFLQLGCGGSPLQGYPTIVVVLSTIPASILGTKPTDWSELLTSFWAALDGRALSSLDRLATNAAFLNSLLECVELLVRRSLKMDSNKVHEPSEGGADGPSMGVVVGDQLRRAWSELVTGRLRVETEAAGKALARILGSLENIDKAIFEAAWEPIASSLLDSCQSPLPPHANGSIGERRSAPFAAQITLLHSVFEHLKTDAGVGYASKALVSQIARQQIERCDLCLNEKRQSEMGKKEPEAAMALDDLRELLENFGLVVLGDTELPDRLDGLLKTNLSSLLASSSGPPLLLTYLSRRDFTPASLALWHLTLSCIASHHDLQATAFTELLKGVENGMLSAHLRPEEDELDGVAGRLIANAMSARTRDSDMLESARLLLKHPGYFLSRQASNALLHTIIYAFSEQCRTLFRTYTSSYDLLSLQAPLSLILGTVNARQDVMTIGDIRIFFPDVFILGFLFSQSGQLSDEKDAVVIFSQAREIWRLHIDNLEPEEKEELFGAVRRTLKDLIGDIDSRILPTTILQVLSEGHLGTSYDLLRDIFPSEEELEEMFLSLPPNPLDPILSVVDPLVPPRSLWASSSHPPSTFSYDTQGLSEYASIVNALLAVATADRFLARANVWLLRHFLVLSGEANDLLLVPKANSPTFSGFLDVSALEDVVDRVQTLTAFLLSDIGDEGWHSGVVKACLQGTLGQLSSTDSVAVLLHMLLDKVRANDSVRDSRVLYVVMQHILSGAETADAEQWMGLARKIEKQAPQASLAIVLAVTESGLEPPSLNRYRNELAAGILGIRASNANTDGLSVLRRLAISAPDPDSDVVFLPQNRAVNFMKVCKAWITSDDEDEELSEDVLSEMTGVFLHLAPILQNVAGSHWELIFDVSENNLEENCSFAEDSTLPCIARTLKLVMAVQELASTNKSLRAEWQSRELTMLTLIRDLVQKASIGQASPSVPRSLCWEMALTIVQNLPPSLIDKDTLPKMAHLLLDPSPEVAKMAYTLLHEAAKIRTEHLVIEAGVDTSEDARFDLPPELVLVLQTALDGKEEQSENVLGYLLGWMIAFDLFDDASLRVKMGYAAHLRDLGLIGSTFLPNILDLLDVYGGRSKPFPLELWHVEEYYIQLFDPESPLSPRLLAAHLFYRALLNVPSLISSWWSDCKDRQLSSAVATLTTRHYSPVLISAELRHVKDPVGTEELAGENWSIKVAVGTGEVTASYMVDDQEMEIAVKLPPDYPLHSIEVREVRRLGVEEKRWRGWLLAVQQVLTSQNGRIVDGLSMFKKNVTHHFENQTECAICYSIISVTDLALPKKRCKTCKNRFHAGCLFKWFNTSHSTSCPLCRSDFI